MLNSLVANVARLVSELSQYFAQKLIDDQNDNRKLFRDYNAIPVLIDNFNKNRTPQRLGNS